MILMFYLDCIPLAVDFCQKLYLMSLSILNFKLFLRKKLLSSPILNCYLNCEEMREKSDASKDCQLDNEIVQIYQWFFLKNSLISIVVLHKCPYFASVFLTTLVFLQNFFRMIFNSKTINSTHCSVSALYLFLKFCSQF